VGTPAREQDTEGQVVAKYLLIYHGGDQPQGEDEGKAVMAAWMAWFEGLGAAVADGGNPTGAAKSVAPDGSVADYDPASLTGYSILDADSLDAAVAMAQGCPHLGAGGTVTVHATFEVM
jgi:hypothetical protein